MSTNPDELRVVYGARCMWWDTIDKASATDSGLPITPCCGSPMFEVDNEAVWFAQVDDYERTSSTEGYRRFIEWLRGKHYPTKDVAMAAWRAEGSP